MYSAVVILEDYLRYISKWVKMKLVQMLFR
jgi:hypothetical protein